MVKWKKRGKILEQKTDKKETPPPRYDEAFKTGAVRMVSEQGREPKQVARDLGICIDPLRNWLKSAGIQLGQISRHSREQHRIREVVPVNSAKIWVTWVRIRSVTDIPLRLIL